jgi:hypothetical protein
MRPRSLAALVLCALTAACARAPAVAPVADALDARRTARAAELAPDLYGRALRARREAASAGERAARENANARAELWMEAALVEAERIEAQRAASAAEARTLQAEARRVAAQREREQLERELALAEAGRIARARAERMLAGGALAEAAQHGDDAALAAATAFALERASLLLAAARALGLDDASAAPLTSRLASLTAQAASRARLRAALALLEALERALGSARAARPGPSEQERASLRADAAERGLTLELQPACARLLFDTGVFAPGRSEPSPGAARTFTQLAAFLRMHSRGALELAAGPSPLAARRARAVAARLRAFGNEAHIVAVPAETPSTGASPDAIALCMPAYGSAAPAEARAITAH